MGRDHAPPPTESLRFVPVDNDEWNATLRRRGRPLPREAEQPEPKPEPLPDLGAGARATTVRSDSGEAMNQWIRGQARKSRLAPQTVELPLNAMRKP